MYTPQNISLRTVLFVMFKNVSRSPLYGALVTVLLIAVLVQIVTSYRFAEPNNCSLKVKVIILL